MGPAAGRAGLAAAETEGARRRRQASKADGADAAWRTGSAAAKGGCGVARRGWGRCAAARGTARWALRDGGRGRGTVPHRLSNLVNMVDRPTKRSVESVKVFTGDTDLSSARDAGPRRASAGVTPKIGSEEDGAVWIGRQWVSRSSVFPPRLGSVPLGTGRSLWRSRAIRLLRREHERCRTFAPWHPAYGAKGGAFVQLRQGCPDRLGNSGR